MEEDDDANDSISDAIILIDTPQNAANHRANISYFCIMIA